MVRELARIAFVDPTQAIDFECAGLREDAKADDRAALMSVRVKSGDDFTEREVRLYDKVRALELLGKHLGMFTEKVELSGERVRIVDDVPGGGARWIKNGHVNRSIYRDGQTFASPA